MNTPAATLSIPPLPDYLPPAGESSDDAPITISPRPTIGPITPVQLRTIRCGCWLVSYRPAGIGLVAYDGTMRVECHSEGRTASGDLYQRPTLVIQQPVPIPLPG